MLHYDQSDLLNESGVAKVLSEKNANIYFYLSKIKKGDGKRPKIVKRGIDEVIEKMEPDEIQEFDHLCFVVHGIGEGCDFKFRPLEDCGI